MKSLTQKRRIYKQLRDATALPDPMRSYEEWSELQDPGHDLIGADRLELRQAWQAVELALLLNDGNKIVYMDEQKMITAQEYLLKRLAAIKRLWRGAAG